MSVRLEAFLFAVVLGVAVLGTFFEGNVSIIDSVPSVIQEKEGVNEVLVQYGTNADNSVFFVETENTETKAVFVRVWKDGQKIVDEQR